MNRDVLRVPRAANAPTCYACESVTEGIGRTRLRLSQCNVRTDRICGETGPRCFREVFREKRKNSHKDIFTTRVQEKDRQKGEKVRGRGAERERKRDREKYQAVAQQSERVCRPLKITLRLRYTRIIAINVHVRGETELATTERATCFRDISQPEKEKRELARRYVTRRKSDTTCNGPDRLMYVSFITIKNIFF